MGEEEQDVVDVWNELIERRAQRDQLYLRTEMNAMSLLAEDSSEWIMQETRDLLIIVGILKNTDNPAVAEILTPLETRISKIQSSYLRKNIALMKKFSRGRKGIKSEAELHQNFVTAIEGVEKIILELRSIRNSLDAIIRIMLGSEYQDTHTPFYTI